MIAADQAAVNLAVATVLSATIGFERQWRQRLAELRTNSLVAIGAASFVIFASLIPGEASPTRVAAQVKAKAPQPTPNIHDGVLICLLASNDHIGETTCLG